MKTAFIVIITFCFKYIFSADPCSDITPTKVSDCIPKSNSTHLCCLLNATDVPALYTTCMLIPTNMASPMLTVGNMYYTVNCKGVANFKTYFPFEDEYT